MCSLSYVNHLKDKSFNGAHSFTEKKIQNPSSIFGKHTVSRTHSSMRHVPQQPPPPDCKVYHKKDQFQSDFPR